ncbi:hypothetical protein SAMN04515667_2253 [Formosa sp. Hel1_31_208]|uniref:hypothetical protein n=1 Tax=Formosa sp. Hel1_31_208 TaxID=1798225 RepID=UPI00087B7266|nr:hypothetical protein [Formosa sp. Hel1_31_208]SDS47210.1 hypothetical protein SAMN04515667_2253 [Formosa sp. Hel1_31_208]
MLTTYTTNISLASTMQLTIVLIVTASIFLVFIAVAIFKMYKLKAENKRLTDNSFYKTKVDKSYQDFTDGHLYDNNN